MASTCNMMPRDLWPGPFPAWVLCASAVYWFPWPASSGQFKVLARSVARCRGQPLGPFDLTRRSVAEWSEQPLSRHNVAALVQPAWQLPTFCVGGFGTREYVPNAVESSGSSLVAYYLKRQPPAKGRFAQVGPFRYGHLWRLVSLFRHPYFFMPLSGLLLQADYMAILA